MTKIFYDSLVNIEEVLILLDKYDISHEEKEELKKIIDEIFHHHILTEILDHLPSKHHQQFLINLFNEPNKETHLQFLAYHTQKDMESIIKDKVKVLKNELKSEVSKLTSTRN